MDAAARPVERYLTVATVCAMVPFTRVHVMRLAKAGKFPRPVKLSERRVAFKETEIAAWLDARERAWPPREDSKSPR